MAPIDPEALLDSKQTAKMLHVKEQTWTQWRHEGHGPRYVKIGRKCFSTLPWIQEYLASLVRDPAAEITRAA